VYVGTFESGELGKSWNAQESLLVHLSTISPSGSCAFLGHTPEYASLRGPYALLDSPIPSRCKTLACIIHEGSSRKRADVKRDGHSEP
jgi:hypothetical protein